MASHKFLLRIFLILRGVVALESSRMTFDKCKWNYKSLLHHNECYNASTYGEVKIQPQTLYFEEAIIASTLCTSKWLVDYFGSPVAIVTNNRSQRFVKSIISQNSHFVKYDVFSLPQESTTIIAKQFLSWKASEYRIFMILCSIDCAVNALHYASVADMFDKTYTWIVMTRELSQIEFDLPETFLSMEHRFTGNSEIGINFNCSNYLTTSSKREYAIEAVTNNDILPNIYLKEPKHGWTRIETKQVNIMKISLKSLDYRYCNPINVIKAVTIIEPPFTMFSRIEPNPYDNTCAVGKTCFVYNQNQTNLPLVKCCYGFAMEFLQIIERELNFISELYLVGDSLYGAKSNGSWNGMMGDIINGKADLAVAPLIIFDERAKVVDFSEPFMMSGIAIAAILQEQKEAFLNVIVFAPISWQLCLATIGIVLVTSFLLVYLEEKEGSTGHHKYSLNESVLYLMGLLFQRDMGGENPHYTGTRVAAMAVAIFTLVIMSTYTAVLTANKVTHSESLPISGFKDKLITDPSDKFKYATLENSGIYNMFNHTSNSAWKRMYKFMASYNFVDTAKAMEDLKTGKLGAVILDLSILLYYGTLNRDCKLQIAGLPIGDAGYGLASSKSSGLNKKLSKAIRKFKDDGTMSTLRSKWFPRKCVEARTSSVQQMSIDHFNGLFLVMACCICLATILLLIEFAIKSYFNKKFEHIGQHSN